jgi:hypothetical protein
MDALGRQPRFNSNLTRAIMDALKAEIASKRKAIESEPVLANRPTKYMRRGDIERLREEAEQKALEEKRKLELEEAERKAALERPKKKPTEAKVSCFLSCFSSCPNT